MSEWGCKIKYKEVKMKENDESEKEITGQLSKLKSVVEKLTEVTDVLLKKTEPLRVSLPAAQDKKEISATECAVAEELRVANILIVSCVERIDKATKEIQIN